MRVKESYDNIIEAQDQATRPMPDSYAVANSMARTISTKMTLPELKVFFLCLTKIDWSKKNPKNEEGMIEVRTSINEIKNAIGTESNNYDFYKQLLLNLAQKAFYTVDIPKYFMAASIIPYVSILDARDIVIRINPDTYQYLEDLYTHYTVYRLKYISKLRSKHAIALYLNLYSWNNHRRDREDPLDERSKVYSTKQLKQIFGLSVDDYVRKNGSFNRHQFEKKVIQKAVDEINSTCNIRVGWSKDHDGKKVIGYRFTWYMNRVKIDDNLGIIINDHDQLPDELELQRVSIVSNSFDEVIETLAQFDHGDVAITINAVDTSLKCDIDLHDVNKLQQIFGNQNVRVQYKA